MTLNIKRIETFTTTDVCFVRVTSVEGYQGWGQTAPYQADISAHIIHRQIAPHALAQSGANIDYLVDMIYDREHKFPGSHLCRAISGLDTALWDLQAKVAGKSVCELIGGSPGKISAYGSSMKRDISPKNEAERFKKLRDKFGFDAFKFRIGSEVGHNVDEWPGRTTEIISTISKTFNNEVALLVDANSCYSPKQAIEIGHMLQDNGITHYEEPCPYWHYEQTKQVTDALKIDVTGGEQDCSLVDWQRMIDQHIVDIIQPDVCYLGGITRTLRVVEMAAKMNIPVTPHCANLSMVTLFTMHLLRAIPNAGKYLEFSIEEEDYYPWQYNLFVKSPFTIENGKATVTDAPGWGVEVSPEWLAKSTYQISEI